MYEWNPKKRKMEPRPGSTDDPGGVGREAVREIHVCSGCAAIHKGVEAE